MNSTRRASLIVGACLALAATVVGPVGAAADGPRQVDDITLNDDTGLLRLDVPSHWTDVTTAPLLNPDGTNNAQITAAPNLQAFFDTHTAAGVIYTAIDYNGDTDAAIVNAYDFTGICTDAGIESYSDGYFIGSRQTWTGCEGTTSRIITLAVNPLDRSFTATVLVQVPTAADEATLQTILDSFYVVVPTTTQVRDDTGTITVSIPASWIDVDTRPQTFANEPNGATNPSIVAATDLSIDQYIAAGLFYSALPFRTDLQTLMTSNTVPECAPGQATEYSDGYFTGLIQEQTACNGTAARRVTVVANPSDSAFTAVLLITLPEVDPVRRTG